MPDRTYRPAPPRGPLGDRVAQTPPEDRARVRARIFLEHNRPRTFERDGIRYTLNDIRLMRKGDSGELVPDDNGEVLHVNVSAVKIGKGGGPIEVDNPYLFVNPPLAVPDGTYRKELHGDTELEIANATENPEAALEELISAAVRR